MATLLDGKAVAAQVRTELLAQVAKLKAERGYVPGLAVVRVGDDASSKTYVGLKHKAATELGFLAEELHLPETATHEDVLAAVQQLNLRSDIHGILVQLPLPAQIRAEEILLAVDPSKDVDGLHPVNAGALAQDRPGLRPCTPAGILRLLSAYDIPLAGKRALVVGRSNLVGKPVAQMLLAENATVTVAHRQSVLAEEVPRADILVVAAGVRGLVRGEWVKEGAVVVDVGMNRNSEGKLCGDVEFAEAEKRAAFITPVPGGVGPLTIVMLMRNTVLAALG